MIFPWVILFIAAYITCGFFTAGICHLTMPHLDDEELFAVGVFWFAVAAFWLAYGLFVAVFRLPGWVVTIVKYIDGQPSAADVSTIGPHGRPLFDKPDKVSRKKKKEKNV